jgi:hypothetical protein
MCSVTHCRWIIISISTISFQGSFKDLYLNHFDKYSRCELCHSFTIRAKLLTFIYWFVTTQIGLQMKKLQTMLAQRQNRSVVGGQAQVSVLKPGSDTMCKAFHTKPKNK